MFTAPGGRERIPILAPLRQQGTLGPLPTVPTGPTQRQLPDSPAAPALRRAAQSSGLPSASCLPVSLPHRLLLLRLADVPHVVQGEEQKVPVGGKPRQGERSIELPEGQLGELRGACPGGAHAQHHRHAPEHLLELRPGASPALVARSAAGLRPSRRRGLRRARGVPGALLPWGKRRGWLPGGPAHLPLTAPDQGVGGSQEAPDPTVAVMASHPGRRGMRGCGGSFLKQNLNGRHFSLVLLSSGILTLTVWSLGWQHEHPPPSLLEMEHLRPHPRGPEAEAALQQVICARISVWETSVQHTQAEIFPPWSVPAHESCCAHRAVGMPGTGDACMRRS